MFYGYIELYLVFGRTEYRIVVELFLGYCVLNTLVPL
jgi:hypothetical protein